MFVVPKHFLAYLTSSQQIVFAWPYNNIDEDSTDRSAEKPRQLWRYVPLHRIVL
jgi:hypothetical protein